MNYSRYFVRVRVPNDTLLCKFCKDRNINAYFMPHMVVSGNHNDTHLYSIFMNNEEATVLKLAVPIVGNIVECP